MQKEKQNNYLKIVLSIRKIILQHLWFQYLSNSVLLKRFFMTENKEAKTSKNKYTYLNKHFAFFLP